MELTSASSFNICLYHCNIFSRKIPDLLPINLTSIIMGARFAFITLQER